MINNIEFTLIMTTGAKKKILTIIMIENYVVKIERLLILYDKYIFLYFYNVSMSVYK